MFSVLVSKDKVIYVSTMQVGGTFSSQILPTCFNNGPRLEKTGFCLGENKDADQLRSSCKADLRLCVRYADNTIPPLT